MSKSLFDLQSVLEEGNNLSKLDFNVMSYGFYSAREYYRYNSWRKANGKSILIKDPSFTEDLEWWREHVDYCFIDNLIKYFNSLWYNVDRRVVSNFKRWCSKNKYTYSNQKECLELFKDYWSKHKSVKRPRCKGKEADIDILFKSYRQRCIYDNYCKTQGFSISTDRERYLSGIEEWKKSNSDVENAPEELFDTKAEKDGFHAWCKRNRVPIGMEEELLSAVNQYKKLKEYKKRLRSIQWVDSEQRGRHDKYCRKLGFNFTSDPERYLSSYQDWSDNIDLGPYVDWKLYFSSEAEHGSYFDFCRRYGYTEPSRLKGFQERYEKWKDWYENERDARYIKK